jgi:hypothetical protein
MVDKLNINEIYDKNINFLIGSGASFGLFPTLALDIKNDWDEFQTVETLATIFEQSNERSLYTLLFMHYYKECIEPVMKFDLESAKKNQEQKKVTDNYERFLNTLLVILQRRKSDEKTCNIFTTNYDGCFAHVADDMFKRGNIDFIVNDGARGFSRRYLQARNFNSVVSQTGVFERHRIAVPQINLIHVHGSAYWYKDGTSIRVDYSKIKGDRLIQGEIFERLQGFSHVLKDSTKTIGDLPATILTQEEQDFFWNAYTKLPIVNPTKWKFHETVFEEHYYQMLRLLSYELEKPNAVFITFGFSFADEHILNLVRRSLSNPSLQVFVCCFNEAEQISMQELFKIYRNVQFISVEGFLTFSAFNDKVFTLDHTPIAVLAPEQDANV